MACFPRAAARRRDVAGLMHKRHERMSIKHWQSKFPYLIFRQHLDQESDRAFAGIALSGETMAATFFKTKTKPMNEAQTQHLARPLKILSALAFFVMLILPLGGVAKDIANGASASAEAAGPARDPADLWQRILKYLQKDQGFATQKELESLFDVPFSDVKMKGRKDDAGASYMHSFKKKLPKVGLLSIGFLKVPEQVRLSVTWEFQRSVPASSGSGCVRLDDATADLNKLGWIASEVARRPENGSRQFWRKEAVAESAKAGGRPLDVFSGSSQLTLVTSHQNDQCVNGFVASVYKAQ